MWSFILPSPRAALFFLSSFIYLMRAGSRAETMPGQHGCITVARVRLALRVSLLMGA